MSSAVQFEPAPFADGEGRPELQHGERLKPELQRGTAKETSRLAGKLVIPGEVFSTGGNGGNGDLEALIAALVARIAALEAQVAQLTLGERYQSLEEAAAYCGPAIRVRDLKPHLDLTRCARLDMPHLSYHEIRRGHPQIHPIALRIFAERMCFK